MDAQWTHIAFPVCLRHHFQPRLAELWWRCPGPVHPHRVAAAGVGPPARRLPQASGHGV